MRQDRRGLAGLFDALVFLTVASLVSVTLLSALSSGSSTAKGSMEEVDAVHLVLLRSTVPDARGNPVTIEEAFKLRSVDIASCEDNITKVLALLLPGSEWRWSVEHGPRNWTFGSETVPSSAVYCSLIRVPFNGSEIVYRLDTWSDQS